MRRPVISLAMSAAAPLVACSVSEPSASEKKAIATEIEAEVRSAYDLKSPDVEKSLEKLYADSGRVVSASSGMVIASRDMLFAGTPSGNTSARTCGTRRGCGTDS